MSRSLTNVSKISVPTNETLKIEGTGSIRVPYGDDSNDGRYIRMSSTSLTFPSTVSLRPSDILVVEGTPYAPWMIPGTPIFIYSAANPTVWAQGEVVSYSHPNLEILFDFWESDSVFHNDWQIGSYLELGSVRFNEDTFSLDFVVPVPTNAETTIRTSNGSSATYLKLATNSTTFALPGDLILNGLETEYDTNQPINATHNKLIVKLNSVSDRTFTVADPVDLGAKFYTAFLNVNSGNMVINGTFAGGITTITLKKGQSALLVSDGVTNKLMFRPNRIQAGNNVLIDDADPTAPIIHAKIPLLVEGHGVAINNDDVYNPVVSAKDFFIIPASDETSPVVPADAKVTFRTPYAFSLVGVRGSLNVEQTSGPLFTVDIKRWNGSAFVSILSTPLTFDNGQRTTTTASTQPVISYSNIVDDEELRIDVTQVGDGTATGLKITLLGE